MVRLRVHPRSCVVCLLCSLLLLTYIVYPSVHFLLSSLHTSTQAWAIHTAASRWRETYFLHPGSISIPDCRVYTNPKEILLLPDSLRGDAEKAKFIFSVNSAPQNTHRRNMLRQLFSILHLYMRTRDDFKECEKFVYMFVVGSTQNHSLNKDLVSESNAHRDLLMSHVEDSYTTLTLKTFFALQLIVSVRKSQGDYSQYYVIKMDDDGAFGPFGIAKLLKELSTTTPTSLYAGMRLVNPPKRVPVMSSGPFAINVRDFDRLHYPYFNFGFFVLFSPDVLALVARCHQTCLAVEDATLGICISQENIPLTDIRYLHHLGHVWLSRNWAEAIPKCNFFKQVALFDSQNQETYFHYVNTSPIAEIEHTCAPTDMLASKPILKTTQYLV